MSEQANMPPDTTVPFQIADASGHYQTTRPVTADEVIAFSAELLAARFKRHGKLVSAADSRRFFITRLANCEREVFACAFLDSRHSLIAFEELFYGTIDGATVHPRQVVRRTLHHNAADVILAHNHPSGDPDPSQQDKDITQKVKAALELIDVRVLDHIVVGGVDAVSFAERGLL